MLVFRSPKLPVGVECTLEILQIRLFDSNKHESPCTQKDLQLMYSTTLMRYVVIVCPKIFIK